MKIIAAKFVLEANENVPMRCDIENVAFDFGDKCIAAMQLGNATHDSDLQLIPLLSANAGSSGVMTYNCFRYIETRILDGIRSHLSDLDGIYLHLHGASYVETIGSGDFHILKEIRNLVGPYVPVAVACDPHGNLCKEYVEQCTLIRSYRESPHTDIEQTNEFVLNELKDIIRHRQNIHAIYRKLPMILGGEQSVSSDEPVKTINRHLDELQKDPKIRSCSWHVGYIRHDCDEAGCGIVVVPQTQQDTEYCETVADQLAQYVFDKRHEFHYTGLTADPDKALQMVLQSEEKPNFITDSGDNVTSGATGANTTILRQVLAQNTQKKILFASIHDDNTFTRLADTKTGQQTDIQLGADYNELSAPVPLTVEVIKKAPQLGTSMFGEYGTQGYGEGILVHVISTNIDIIVASSNHPFVERQQVRQFGIDWFDYDITVVKCGYAFPELVKDGNVAVMSLTEGATLQDTSRLPFKRILRPMYPIDNI
ncbi:MAG: M81 family metallopeptidase [Erysipelotrichaceae bacterium]|nr:M81 family metallopeptidase [Erysipelotrichaceae bacterium]